MLGVKTWLTPGVSCNVLAYFAGGIWETEVTPKSNGRLTGMRSCSPVSPPVLKSFHSVQVCWARLEWMINRPVQEQLFGGQLKQKKPQTHRWNKWRAIYYMGHLPKLFFQGSCTFFPLWKMNRAIWFPVSLPYAALDPHHFTLASPKLFSHGLPCFLSFSLLIHSYCRKIYFLKHPFISLFKKHSFLKAFKDPHHIQDKV